MFSILVSATILGLSIADHSHHKHAARNPSTSENATLSRRSLAGPATHYQGNMDGACQFTGYTIPAGLYGTALAVSNWDNSYNCGGCVRITNANGVTIKAMIVDECMTCAENGLDLFPDAFAVMDPGSGNFPVTWEYVKCFPAVKGPLRVHLESGVTQYWFSAQIRNAGRRTANVEVSTNGGDTWLPTIRKSYNYWVIEAGTPGVSSVNIRATSHVGSHVIVENVPVVGGAVAHGNANYA